MIIRTARLRLVAATRTTIRADLQGPAALAAALGVAVPDSWPPEYYDADAMQTALNWLETLPDIGPWCFYYIVRADPAFESQLVGVAGYKGRPSGDGTVEIGYSILAQHQRIGIATEAAGALVDQAFQHAEVQRVIAETLPELVPSIGVLTKLGFRFIGDGSEPGVIRYELTRAAAGSCRG